jgi:hypothetical protein
MAVMVLLVHGAAGGSDELVIAAVGLAVLWVAVKLAGRKRANDDDQQDAVTSTAVADNVEEEHRESAHPPATKLG